MYKRQLLINGSFGDFGSYRDLIHGNRTTRQLELGATLRLSGLSRNYRFLKSRIGAEDSVGFRSRFKYRSRLKEIVLCGSELFSDESQLLGTKASEDFERQLVDRIRGQKIPMSKMKRYSRGLATHNFLPLRTIMPMHPRDSSLDEESQGIEKDLRSAAYVGRAIAEYFQGTEYVGAMRLPPERTHIFTGERRRRVGSAGENAINLIALDNLIRGARKRNIKDQVVEWLKKSGLASGLEITE